VTAAKYYKLAADQHLAEAQCNYASCLANGQGVSIDLVSAAKYFKMAADQKYAAAQCNYGVCLRDGEGVGVDLVGAAKYFKMAADQNHAAAQCNYGLCLRESRGVGVDFIGAAKYYKLAADQNDARGQFNYGVCLEKGLGVEVDFGGAAKYYKLAADQNHAAAQLNYGLCVQHSLGIGADDDQIRAFVTPAANGWSDQAHLAESPTYYRKSADQGHPDGTFLYGTAFHYGLGVDVDLEESSLYYELAADNADRWCSISSLRCWYACGNIRACNSSRAGIAKRVDGSRDIFEDCLRMRPAEPSLPTSGMTSFPLPADARWVGAGGFSTVRLGRDPKTGREMAIKIISNDGFDEVHFKREVETLMALNHPCVVRIAGWSPRTGSTPAEIWTEFAGNNSLEKVLERVKWGGAPSFWTPTGKAIIICGIALGMRYIHSKGFIHRDLKPGNILIDGYGHSLISDFGTVWSQSYDTTLIPDTGTLHYAAPEMVYEDRGCTAKVDVFSFGSILFEILSEKPVFGASLRPFPIMRELLSGHMPAIPDVCGSRMQDLIRRCWLMDPELRPSFDAIIREFSNNRFDVVPGAQLRRVREYVEGVCKWEAACCSVSLNADHMEMSRVRWPGRTS
jgi:TPR repeat protein